LVGGKDGFLPANAILYHLTVEHAVLVEFAARSGITELEDLFPSRKEDFILRALLGLPWETIKGDSPIGKLMWEQISSANALFEFPENIFNRRSLIRKIIVSRTRHGGRLF
jgi:hypothetical protein